MRIEVRVWIGDFQEQSASRPVKEIDGSSRAPNLIERPDLRRPNKNILPKFSLLAGSVGEPSG